MAAKQITQETFDDVVKENMEDFEMSAEEAIEEAKGQFEAQGVNLANIIQDPSLFSSGSAVVHPVVQAIQTLREALQSDQPVDPITVEQCCHVIEEECDKDLAHRCYAAKHQCYEVLHQCLQTFETNPHALKPVLTAFCSFCNGQPDLIQPDCMDLLLRLLDRASEMPEDVIVLAVRSIRLNCIMHETNRQTFIEKHLITKLVVVLEHFSSKGEVVKEACGSLKVLTNDDDPRVTFCKAHDHAKMIVLEANALKRILDLCSAHTSDATVLTELFATLSRLAVRNEFCQEILDLGGLAMMLEALQENLKTQKICVQALRVLKAISGNDQVKVAIVRASGLQVVLATLAKHLLNPAIAETAASTIASVVLRAPEHCKVAMQAGAAEDLVKTMAVHPDNAAVQMQCCRAIRNLVCRSQEYCSLFIDAGAEPHIVKALNTHQDLKDEAKAALRDLGCKVELVERWKGEGRVLAR